MKLINHDTGEVLYVDSLERRVNYMQRRVMAWESALKQQLGEVGTRYRLVWWVLTYRPGEEWRKLDISEFMARVRGSVNLLAYCWIAEVQARGAVHYNVYALVPVGSRLPMVDDAGWWTHGTAHVQSVKDARYGASAEGAKWAQKEGLPRNCRMFAVWISRGLVSKLEFFRFRLSVLPSWLMVQTIFSGRMEIPHRETGSGWVTGCGDALRWFFGPWDLARGMRRI